MLFRTLVPEARRYCHAIPLYALCMVASAGVSASAHPDVEPGTCAVRELPGLSAQLTRAQRVGATGRAAHATGHADGLTPAGAVDFWQVATSVLRLAPLSSSAPGRMPVAAVGLPSLEALPCGPDVRARDRVAWSMGLVGYSAREIADVIDGHLTRAAIDQAYARAMAGMPREAVAAFLDAHWRDEPAPVERALTATALPCGASPASTRRSIDHLAADLAALAHQHRVPPALIRAVIAAESGGNPCAISRAGAIGLMQLMPATAAALGVDPWKPLENLRGGIVYLGSLLRTFGEDARLALIAYNAGPQHAERVRTGQAVAYRETRQYLDAIAARYPLQW